MPKNKLSDIKKKKNKMILAIKMIKSNKRHFYSFEQKMISEKEVKKFFSKK